MCRVGESLWVSASLLLRVNHWQAPVRGAVGIVVAQREAALAEELRVKEAADLRAM